jgi:hypothetical protein
MAKAPNRNSANREIPVKTVSEFSVDTDEMRHRRIAEKAHELYQCRGCCHGRDVDDWLEAERIILSEMAAAESDTSPNPRPGGPRSTTR